MGKRNSAGSFLDKVINTNLTKVADTKSKIKHSVQENQRRNARRRAIESNDERTVHFVFKPPHDTPETPFSKKFAKLMEGSLEDFEA
jgi:hypothetical protein